MADGSGTNTYYCTTCLLRFSLYARRKPKAGQVCCPLCWDTESVQVFNREKHRGNKRAPRRGWTTKEKQKLEKLLAKGYTPKGIASLFGRTPEALRKAAVRFGYITKT